MPGPVFPGKNMPQKRKEKSLFSIAPQGISGIFRKKARLAPFFGKKPAEEDAPPAFPRLMRAPEKKRRPLRYSASRRRLSTACQKKPRAGPPAGSPSQKALASPPALPPPGNDAPRRISEGHPDRCSRKAPLPHASGLVQGNPARVVRLRIPPAPQPRRKTPRTAARRLRPAPLLLPARQKRGFPQDAARRGGAAPPPKKAGLRKAFSCTLSRPRRSFREPCCVESPPRKSGLSALLSGRGTPFPPLDGAECRETQKKRYFQLTLVFNFTNTALSLPRGAARSACTASCGPAAALPSSRGRNDSRNPCPEFEKEFHFYIEEEPCLR